MQAGSLVATTSSPPIQSSRNLAAGNWKAKVDRQLSLDRSHVSISGSFTQSPSSHQVPVKNNTSSTPWTPAPPRSPRQRTMSPLRMNEPRPAVVLSREPLDDNTADIYQERFARKKSLDGTATTPVLGMPRGQARQTPKRSSSPRQRTCSPAPVMIVKDADGTVLDMSSSFLSANAAYQQPIVTKYQQPNKSPRDSSPFRWKGPQAPLPARVLEMTDDLSRSIKALNSVPMNPDEKISAMSAIVRAQAAPDDSIDMPRGPPASAKIASTQQSARVQRTSSPFVRARTLSPARRANPAAMVLTKDADEGGGAAGRNRMTAPIASERAGDQNARLRAAVSVAAPALKDSAAASRLPRGSAPLITARDEVETLRRPQASSAALPKDVEVLEPAEQGVCPGYLDLKPWLEAAHNFHLNTDFEITTSGKMDFAQLMTQMKKESADKWTIQTMADKLLLNGLLENLGLPHMPMIFASRSLGKLRERLEVLVDKLIIATTKKQPYDIIVKPTHLSSAQGVMSFNKVHAPHREDTIRQLEKHMRKYIETQANKQESLALQSLKPGFIGQPKYKSIVGFKAPLELKVCALWGKARCGVWWWGTRMAGPAQVPHRNVWIVRDPIVPGELNDNDNWEVVHNHPGGNVGWEQAVKLFKRHMPAMANLAETLATALGTPFLRADFFVGSPKWGVRLNEVAYGCGLEYRSLLREGSLCRVIDDKPAMTEILNQGMNLCHRRLPPQHFLHMLGVQGNSYEDTAVVPLSVPLTNFSSTMSGQSDPDLKEYAVEEDLCKSVKELGTLKENTGQYIDQVAANLIHKPHLVKPHPAQIPTLVMQNGQMAKVITNSPHLVHQFQGPLPPGGYVQAPVQSGAGGMAPPGYQAAMAPGHQPIMLRGPMR